MTYTYQHYPLWVTPSGGVPCIVHTPEQEAAVAVTVLVEEFGQTPTEKEALRNEASAIGISVDGRWSVDRLKTEIAARAAQPELPA